MTRWPFKLLLLLSVAAAILPGAITDRDKHKKKTVLTVGYLTAIKGELRDKQGLAISGALTMALDEVYNAQKYRKFLTTFYLKINKDPYLLPNVTLELRWNDTRGETVLATRAITEMICDGI